MKTIFSKYSNERAPRFAIKTIIVKDDKGNMQVRKYPQSPEAKGHIEKMLESCEKISKYYASSGFKAAKAYAVNEGTAFDYVAGKTFEEMLEEADKDNKPEKVLELIEKFRNMLMKNDNVKPFVPTEEFISVFGNEALPDELNAMDFTCMDLAFSNLIINDDGINVIDYEWCFDFPVPIEYIVYRAVDLYVKINGKIRLIENDIYGYLGFDKQSRASYDAMEANFQKYVRNSAFSTRDLYEKFGYKNYNLTDIMEKAAIEPEECFAQVYMDYGDGYSESNSYRRMYRTNERVEMNIAFTNKVKSCRFDPEDNSCIMIIERIAACNENGIFEPKYHTNGCESHGVIYFAMDDPQIIFENIEQGAESVQISFKVMKMDKSHIDGIAKAIFDNSKNLRVIDELEKEIDELEKEIKAKEESIKVVEYNLNNELEQCRSNMSESIKSLESVVEHQKQYISNIENSKAWRLVCRIRKMLGK